MERIASFTVNHDAALARQCCAFYAGVIRDWTAEQLVYPE